MGAEIKIERRRWPRPPWLETFPAGHALVINGEREAERFEGQAWEPHPAEQQREDA